MVGLGSFLGSASNRPEEDRASGRQVGRVQFRVPVSPRQLLPPGADGSGLLRPAGMTGVGDHGEPATGCEASGDGSEGREGAGRGRHDRAVPAGEVTEVGEGGGECGDLLPLEESLHFLVIAGEQAGAQAVGSEAGGGAREGLRLAVESEDRHRGRGFPAEKEGVLPGAGGQVEDGWAEGEGGADPRMGTGGLARRAGVRS